MVIRQNGVKVILVFVQELLPFHSNQFRELTMKEPLFVKIGSVVAEILLDNGNALGFFIYS